MSITDSLCIYISHLLCQDISSPLFVNIQVPSKNNFDPKGSTKVMVSLKTPLPISISYSIVNALCSLQ